MASDDRGSMDSSDWLWDLLFGGRGGGRPPLPEDLPAADSNWEFPRLVFKSGRWSSCSGEAKSGSELWRLVDLGTLLNEIKLEAKALTDNLTGSTVEKKRNIINRGNIRSDTGWFFSFMCEPPHSAGQEYLKKKVQGKNLVKSDKSISRNFFVNIFHEN